MTDKEKGFYKKYNVSRVDEKPLGPCVVLEFKDPRARQGIATFAAACRKDGYYRLADGLEEQLKIHGWEGQENLRTTAVVYDKIVDLAAEASSNHGYPDSFKEKIKDIVGALPQKFHTLLVIRLIEQYAFKRGHVWAMKNPPPPMYTPRPDEETTLRATDLPLIKFVQYFINRCAQGQPGVEPAEDGPIRSVKAFRKANDALNEFLESKKFEVPLMAEEERGTDVIS